MSDWRTTTDPGHAAPFGASDDDVLDELVAECVESGSSELATRVESACRDNPRLASALRRRIESLREVGLLQEATLAVDERFPERLGEFRLLERLGGGGMGVVFRARQESLDRDVALKLIRPDQLYFPRARERFQREIEAVARLQHPGIVPIYAVGEEAGVPYFAMELLPGCTLADALRALPPNAPERLDGDDFATALLRCASSGSRSASASRVALFTGTYVTAIVGLIIQVAEALEHAHARDVLHRDVKPSNIAVTLDGRALLFDFGLASFSNATSRLTATNTEVGSIHYMSPEQLRGDAARVGPRSDVYALGVTLYEMLALQLPYAERDLLETRRAILDGRRDPLRARNRAVPRDLEIVCATAMELDSARRYATTAAFAADLRNVLEHRPIDARSPSATLIAARWIRRHPTVSTALAAGGLVAIGLPTALAVQSSRHATTLTAALTDAQQQRALAVDAQAEATKQRDRARDEAEEARKMNAFLVDMFGAIDPSRAKGREVTARELLDHAMDRLDTELPDQPLVRASLLDSLGQSYLSLDRWKEAENALREALALREQYAGAESLEMSESLSSIATLESALGRPEALEHARRAVELRRKLSPEPSFEFADALLGYGRLLDDAERYLEARKAFEEVLAILDQLPGDRREARVFVLGNLAQVNGNSGEYQAAVDFARQAIELQRSFDSRPNTAVTAALNVMALSLVRLERFDEAEPLYDEMLDQERALTGERSERYTAMIASKGACEFAAGRSAAAIELYERAVEQFAEIAPPTNDNALTCRRALGGVYQRAGRWSDALRLFQETAPALVEARGPNNLRVLLNDCQIALCHEALGDWTAAESVLSDALARATEAATSEDDAWEAEAAALLSRYSTRRGELVAAKELLARARGLRDDAQLKTWASVWTRLAAGVLADAEHDPERARDELEPLAALTSGPHWGEWAPMAARFRLASVIASDDPDRARELALRAADELREWVGPAHPEAVAAGQLAERLATR